MKCPICRADEKFIRTFETIQHRNLTERRKFCLQCGSAWKTMEQVFENNEMEKEDDNYEMQSEIYRNAKD